MRSPRRFFTDGEMRDLLRRLRQKARGGRLIDKIDHALVTFAWATGCRASEIASASLDPRQPNWIDLQSGLLTITDAKYDSRGTIPLDASSLRVIRHYVREVRPRIRNAEVMHQLFLTKTGSPYTSNKMTKKMRMLLKRYGLDDKIGAFLSPLLLHGPPSSRRSASRNEGADASPGCSIHDGLLARNG
jgi:integrase